MNYSMPGFSVFHYLLEFAQTVCDAIIFSGFIHVAICVSALLFYMVIMELYHIYLSIHQLLYIEYASTFFCCCYEWNIFPIIFSSWLSAIEKELLTLYICTSDVYFTTMPFAELFYWF